MDYSRLTPDHRFLGDEAVVMQAWKKTHEYVRRHNWYADALELDVSAACLHVAIRDWAELLSGRGAAGYRPDPMRVVLAPKRGPWTFTAGGWNPDPNEPLRLRPLAHICIRDQSIATAAMLCLADAVETAQGDPRRRPGVSWDEVRTVSYGNRLVCQWHRGRANFRWGNAKSYREYYEDYRTFVARSDEGMKGGTPARLATVHVDLEQFYDRVDRTVLIAKLRSIADRYYGSPTSPFVTDRFFESLGGVFDWRWHAEDRRDLDAHAPAASVAGVGLPQGLVASGFFANAYLIDFDNKVRRGLVGRAADDRSWQVVDYCRYVDDMRFIVSVHEDMPAATLGAEVTEVIRKLLVKSAPGLLVNAAKTLVEMNDRLPASVRVAATMQQVQRAVSGPLDADAADQVLGVIDGLFPVSERAAASPRREGMATGIDDPTLLELFTTDLDVRPDTVERFAANRWRRVFRDLRVMSEDESADPTATSKPSLDERAAGFSKTLVRRWIADPSNVRLLRIGLDVYPLPKTVALIIGLLWPHIEDPSTDGSPARLACLYVTAELFKAGATETGMVRDPDMMPAGADLPAYRRHLQDYAERCVASGERLPWYVHQQAMLFLATCGAPVAEDRGRGLAGPDYAELHRNLLPAGTPVDRCECAPARAVALAIVAGDLGGDRARLVARVAATLEACGPADAVPALEMLEAEGGPLADGVREALTATDRRWGRLLNRFMPDRSSAAETALDDKRWLRLPATVGHSGNPFRQENAALALAIGLLDGWPRRRNADRHQASVIPEQVEVRCEDWSRADDPSATLARGFLKVRVGSPLDRPLLANILPQWCETKHAWRLELGRLLRAAVTGRSDLRGTPLPPVSPASAPRYLGFRTSLYKRHFGTFSGAEQLGGPSAPVSPWLGELLQRLLLWPGAAPLADRIRLPDGYDRRDLRELLVGRLRHQGTIYGRASALPMYEVPFRVADGRASTAGEPRPLTVVLAQTVLPRLADFAVAGNGTLDLPAYRRQHRRHLTAVLQLLLRTIDARRTYGRPTTVDLIIFPELCIHQADLRLVERLADKLRAVVFCGTVFHPHPFGGPGPVNSGMWLIPDVRRSGRRMVRVEQGKQHMTRGEVSLGVQPFRPCQWVIRGGDGGPNDWRLSAAICYDATDLHLPADLRNVTDGFLISALNVDVTTFDNMVAALHYHMYQPVLLVNTGEFGGSTGQAPYVERHEKIRVHAHGVDQVVISICELDLLACRRPRPSDAARRVPPVPLKLKTPPAGFRRPRDLT